MRLSKSFSLAAAAGFAAAATVLLATCHPDQQCYLAADCPANFYCVVDNSGWGHCVSAAEVFGVSQDAGALPAPVCADGGTAGAPDSGFSEGGPDSGVDAGLADAGEDAGVVPDAGADAGADAGVDAG